MRRTQKDMTYQSKLIKVGNQPLSSHEQELLVSRLEPYLKGGLSIRKACIASGVSRATLYRVMEERQELRDQIDGFRIFLEILTLNMTTGQLMKVYNKQARGEVLDWKDLRFLMWFATNSRHCRDEFGRTARNEATFDPEVEIRRLMNIIDAS